MSKKLRKITATATATLMVIGSIYGFSTTTQVNAAQPIRVTVDGRNVVFADQQPANINGRVLVPVRGVFEELGFDVDWLPAGSGLGVITLDTAVLMRQPTATTNRTITISIPIGSYAFRATNPNDPFGVGLEHRMDVPAQNINGRVMLPIRAIVESIGLGYVVEWDAPNNTAIITTPAGGSVVTPPVTTPPGTPPAQPPANGTPSQPPVVEGFVDINGIRPVVKTDTEWREVLNSTASSITLPNRRLTEPERQAWIDEYNALGGMNAFELEIIRLTNEYRAASGLDQLMIDFDSAIIARFHSQTLATPGIPRGTTLHNTGPYGGASEIASAWNLRTRSGNAHIGRRTPDEVFDAWLSSEGHRSNILRTTHQNIGVGSVVGNFSHYQIMW